MKQSIIILNLIFVICDKNVKAQDENGLYSRRYERLDIDTVLASPRLVTNYVDCLLNKKPCPPEGKALKKILPEALRTKCGKCWPNQKEGALKVITALYNDYPKHYNALREKWDPTGEYHRRFEEYLRDQSFNSIGSNNNYLDNDDINQGQQTQVITQRPTRQGIKTTTTIQPIIIPPSTTIRQTTIRTTVPRRERLSTTTIRQTTRRTTTTTESSDINSPNDIFNRFGGTDDENVTSSTRATTTTITRRPSRPLPNQPQRPLPNQPTPPVSSNQPQYMPGFVTTTTFNSNNQILNIINRLTTKLSNTADFVAGVLRVPQAIIQKTRNRHRVIWQNLAKNIPPPIQKQTSLTFRLF